MIQGDRRALVGHGSGRKQQLRAVGGVGLDNLEFLWGEGTRLGQNLIGYVHLSHVVEHSPDSEVQQLLLQDSQVASQADAEHGNV